jgi:hypothetical protein
MRRLASEATLRAELHWHAFPPHLFDVSEQILWDHMTLIEIAGQSVNVFDEMLTLLHLASHYVQHRCSEIKVLKDVGAAWERWHTSIDPRKLRGLARTCGLEGALAYAVNDACRAGLCRIAAPFGSRRATLLGRMMPRARERGEPSYRAMLGSVLLATPRKLPGALFHEFFPPLSVLARIYGVPTSRWLYLRYPLRLLRPVSATLARRRYS